MKELNTKNILINLCAKERKTYTSVKHFQELLFFLYDELVKRKVRNDYEINFDVNVYAIEYSLLCNNRIFDYDGDIIYLRDSNITSLVNQYTVDEIVDDILEKFVK